MEIDEYITKDLAEAGAILCSGGKLLRLEQERNYYLFIFADKSLCEQLSGSYWSGELQVSAKSYAVSLKELKDRLFSRNRVI